MNLDELRSVQSKERQKDSLQNLRPSFYQEVGDYIADLEDERERVADRVDDPFSSPEVGRLTDEIETAKDVVEAIYERRMGKLVKQASLSAAGMPADDEGLTAEEADLFDDLVDRIESNKGRVLDVLEGADSASPDAERADSAAVDDPGGALDDAPADRTGVDDTPPPPPMEPSGDRDEADTASGDSSGVSPADVMGGDGPTVDDATETGDERSSDAPPSRPDRSESPADSTSDAVEPGPADSSPESGVESATDEDGAGTEPDAGQSGGEPGAGGSEVDRVTVRITQDVGSILGVDDREYTLAADDVVTLPEQNASPLVEREAAEKLE